MISKERVRKLAQERIDELDSGLFIVEIRISPSSSIQLELDKEEGYVSIDECVSVSRNIEHNLDREKQDFELHVSSAGLDKPLRVIEQYRKNLGKEVVVLRHDGEKMKGKMLEVTDKEIVLENTRKERVEGKKKKVEIIEQVTWPMSEIKETKIVISFK